MNSIIIIGNLTRDVESRKTKSGLSVCNFTVAVKRPFAKDETDFLSVIAWRALAELCAKYMIKGSKCAVRGYLQTRNYIDKDGNKRYKTEIVADDVQFLSTQKQSEPKDAPPQDYEPLDDDQILLVSPF